jgi:hypothetical protein
MKLNFKKGITRIFLVGLVISPIFGFFKLDSEKLLTNNRFYFDSISSIEKELKDPQCLTLLKNNNVDTDQNLIKYEGKCYYINLFWNTITKNKSNPNDVITGKFILQTIENERKNQHNITLLFDVGLYVLGYLFICLVFWMCFMTFRWVKKGFDS